jgi:hypothetical protein
MEKKFVDNELTGGQTNKSDNKSDGYPLYPVDEDIYNKFHKETEIDPEEISANKGSDEKDEAGNIIGNHPEVNRSGRNLDVPGSELDDKLEDIGSEDEENNYYSIGGDGHSDLDENQ